MTFRSSDVSAASEADSRRFGRTTAGGHTLRELTLDSLRRADGPLPLAEVACRVAAHQGECDPGDAPREAVQRVYIALARDQVPALERRGVVEYSADDGTVELVGPGTP